MEDQVKTLFIVYGVGSIARTVGIVIALLALILLIVFKVKNKSIKVPLIVLIIGVLVVIGSTVAMNVSMNKLNEFNSQLLNEDALAKLGYTKFAEDGSAYYELEKINVLDDNGNPFSNETIKESKYTLINLWQPWCTHCVNEFPELEKVYQAYKGQDVNVVGIYSVEEDAEKVKSESGITFPTVRLDEETYKSFTTVIKGSGLPSSVLVDSDGKIINIGENLEYYKDILAGIDDPYISQLYESIAYGEKNYDYWAEILDDVLAQDAND